MNDRETPSPVRSLVSVLMPFRTTPAEHVREAVESVAAQSGVSWELVMIDDGAPAPVRTHVERLADLHGEGRIRVLRSSPRPPVGIAAARNKGLAAARGELLALLDSDDVWLSGRLERHAQILERESGVDLVYGDTLYWRSWAEDATGADFVPRAGLPRNTLLPGRLLLTRMLVGRASVPCPSGLTMRTSAVRRVGGFAAGWSPDLERNNLYEDQAFYSKLLLDSSIWVDDRCMDRYRLHARSVTGGARAGEADSARRAFLAWVESHLKERSVDDPDLYGALKRARWMLDHPRGARLIRMTRRLRNRLRPGSGAA